MFNLLKHEDKGIFTIDLDVDIKDVTEISFLDCFLNKNFCEKNYINKSPGLIFSIVEFENKFFINGSDLKGFTSIYLEKYSNFYKSLKNDYVSVFKPKTQFTLKQLTIELYNINGTKYKELNYTSNDIFNMSLKIVKH